MTNIDTHGVDLITIINRFNRQDRDHAISILFPKAIIPFDRTAMIANKRRTKRHG